ncbi:MAG TPA: TonB-dependent receptor [Candidatus Acidoferrales bacterium]|nr:TonB-dependent receptor [Candidatus Acidoferrales bacterium]
MRRAVVLSLSALCLLAGVVLAQEFRATVSGHVFDASNAAVPGVKITMVNRDTQESTSATADSAGAYTIPLLRPGTYTLTATAAGFKTYIRDNVVLEAAKALGLDISLELGAISEKVEVTAEALALETQSATRSGIVTEQQVAEMPLNARNPFMLGVMMSGVNFNGAAIWQRPFDNGAIAQWSINGGRDSSSEFMLDGASNDGQMGSNNVAYVPIVDAVQEFNIMANMYNAEYGHTGSGIMNVVLKSGGAQHHGTAYEFMRRSQLDANTFQNNAIPATAANPTGGAPRPAHYLDQYGFQVDGPIYFPKLLSKSSPVKLFYMGAFEPYREGTPNPLIVSWPTAEMRTGDFSKLTNSQGQAITIYDPFTAQYDAAGNTVVARQPFPGNVIPANRINPIAANVTKYMPLPNQPSAPGCRYATCDLYLPAYYDKDKFYSLILKFDWLFGSKHRAFFRHVSNDRTEDRAVNGIDNKPGTDGQQPFQRINDGYVVDWVSTVSPTFILNARASYNRFIEKGYGAANAGFDMTSLGISPSLISQLPNQDKIYFGVWNFDNYQNLGRTQSNNYTDTYQAMFNATKVAGNHTLKAGLDVRQINYEIQNTGSILNYTGNTTWTQNAWTSANANSGDGYASFLLGVVGGSSNYPLFPWWKQMYYAFYLNDDWKVSRRLTLNLGLRYDLLTPQYEKWSRQNGPFNPTVNSSITSAVMANVAALGSQIPAQYQSLYNNLANLKGSLTFANTGGLGQIPWSSYKNAIQPRVGLAYQVSEKMVLRAGFGEYYSNPTNDFQQTNGFSTSTSIVNSLDGGRTPIANILSNPYPTGILSPTGSSASSATFVGRNPSWFDNGFIVPSVWQFSAGFQYQLRQSTMFDVSYVGSRSYNLNMQAQYNIPTLAVRKTCNLLEGGLPANCDATVPNPFKGIAAFNGTSYYTSNTISVYNLSRPFPQFSGDMTQYGRNDSSIWYNSLQINAHWRNRSGLTLLANYTLSKQVEEWGFNDRWTNTYQQGPYTLDRPQIIKVTAIYDLPFGEGKHFGANTHGIAKKLISGWQYSNFILDPLSGYPANLPSNAIMLKDPRTPGGGFSGEVNWKAYIVREWNPCVLRQQNDGSIAPTPQSIALGCGSDWSNNWGNYAWLETASYAPRFTPNRSGNIRVHHAVQMDASILKRTRINDRMSFQAGFEAFNILNHNYYGRDNINTDPNSANFGGVIPANVSTQNILPRQIQVRFKFFW